MPSDYSHSPETLVLIAELQKTLNKAAEAGILGIIVIGHLFIEEMLDKALTIIMDESELRECNLEFHQKMRLCMALGWGTTETRAIIKRINKVRNNLAHNRHYQVGAQDLEAFMAILTPEEGAETPLEDVAIAGISYVCGSLNGFQEVTLKQELQQRLSKPV